MNTRPLRVDDEVLRVLFRHSRCYGESVLLPEGLLPDQWRKVNNALVRMGAVRKGDGMYHFHEGGCSALILAARFTAERRERPAKPVFRQRALLERVWERLDMSKQILVVSVPVRQPAGVVEVEDTLAAMRALVGGDIEMHGLGAGIALVCNDDGVRLGLAENGCGILGAYFFCKNDDDGNTVGLDRGEQERVLAYVAQYRQVRHGGKAHFEVKGFATVEEMLEYRERQRFDADHAN